MKRLNLLAVGCVCAAGAALAEPSGDRPGAFHAWSVHDVNRPDPVKVEVGESGVPSDAIVHCVGHVTFAEPATRAEPETVSGPTVCAVSPKSTDAPVSSVSAEPDGMAPSARQRTAVPALTVVRPP